MKLKRECMDVQKSENPRGVSVYRTAENRKATGIMTATPRVNSVGKMKRDALPLVPEPEPDPEPEPVPVLWVG